MHGSLRCNYSVEDFREHFEYLLIENDLWVSVWVSKPCHNSTDLDGLDLWVAPITDEETYCSALHELGHILLRTSHELRAWKWAKNNSLLWTQTMQDVAERCLAGYENLLGIKYGKL